MPTVRHAKVRHTSSWILGGGALALSLFYSFPDEFVRNPDREMRLQRNNVVAFFESWTAFPVWGTLFMVCALSILICLSVKSFRYYLPNMHLLNGVVLAGYTMALFTTSIINPNTFLTTTTLAFLACSWNMVMMWWYTHTS